MRDMCLTRSEVNQINARNYQNDNLILLSTLQYFVFLNKICTWFAMFKWVGSIDELHTGNLQGGTIVRQK